jgi:hypothetical protein
MLYLQPVRNDANLNGDLYQCSLMGTNSIRLASEVTDYYPQNDGTILFSRRTSRSSFDLLYVKADDSGKEKMLHQAFAYGNAAADYAHDRWAAFVRPRLGGGWDVVVGGFDGKNSPVKTLAIPEDTLPGNIAWSGDTLMIMVKKDNGMLAFETNTSDESPRWKKANTYEFPGENRFMLNKSESLDISQVQDGAKPEVEIARVWFTGNRNVVAKISGFTMEGYDLLGSYAFVWGHKGSRPAAYSVDIRTGDTVVSYPGAVSNIKPFEYTPHGSPIPPAPKIE